ncbi:ATP-binding cassette domain-containing protein [Autumnicola musiva]|uniref:ATP-binding cassette domain-containing protein n=1 Tax=Autumnicola musiva TaxID=3075589 RepID=A0ABU3D266_9FLAO|nr:ATP-binding cassette domain-containing protein [Zunongwangia sp. F117]MDT0675626.1 ATP-binding cassette domain-containing protein [Zunongwangia sp. F117]
MKHFGIYGYGFPVDEHWLKNPVVKNSILELQNLPLGEAAVFSEKVLARFIEEDQRHGNSRLLDAGNRSLRSFSSGEKRKVLLNYLLQQNPDILIVDSPFDNLDRQSVEELKITLKDISKGTSIIQFFKRKEDLLPIIDKVIRIENEKIGKVYTTEEFIAESASEEIRDQLKSIPPAPGEFKNIPKSLMKLEDVSVKYEDRPILTNISWEVIKGEFWKLTGPNGSGKTTILSMIYGDNPKAYGENVFLFGNRKGSGETVWEIKKKIGYFSPALTELFSRRNTALEMLISGLVDSIGLYQRPTDKQVALAKQWLKTLNLEHRQNKIFIKLPLLEQRLLLIGRAMIKHPPLLILDEPTTALDDESAMKIINLINLIAAESNSAVIYVSHRKEKGLKPDFHFELIPSDKGSVGKIEASGLRSG